MEIRWHGHSFFSLVASDGVRILIDPFLTERTRLREEDLAADLVLVTHAHGDHLGSALGVDAPLVAVHDIAERLRPRAKRGAIGLGVGGSWRHKGVRVWCTPALHTSGFEDVAPGEALPYGGVACGFVVDDGQTRFYHAGDTGIFGDMRFVIRDLLQPHVAAVPIGDHYTMGVEHAARAVEWLGVGVAIPMHYDTFPEIRADPKEFERRVGHHARVVVPAVDGGLVVEGARIVRHLPA